MYPPIFKVCRADPAVTALLLLDGELRLYPHGRAPQGVVYPYVTWQVINGSPENYLAGRPDTDAFTLQVNCYGNTGTQAQNVAGAIRDAIELTAYVVNWAGDDTDPETNKPYVSFDIDWLVKRTVPAHAAPVSPYVLLVDENGIIWTDENGNPWIEER